ncbi:MAG: glycosyltransferase N-terminal domain-containing protein [Hyphomicrobium sp.]
MQYRKEAKRKIAQIGGKLLARFIKFVRDTSTVIVDPPDVFNRLLSEHPVIIALWHGQFMMSTMHRPEGPRIAAMVARHGDAELIGVAIQKLGLDLVRGAGAGKRRKDRGGASALRAALQCLESGQTFAMTADVPPGPARHCGEGIITLARLSGRPIVPLAVASSRYLSLDTWSRLTINLPYSKLAFVYGEAIHVPPDADGKALEFYREQVEEALNRVTKRSYELAEADPKRATPWSASSKSATLTEPGYTLKLYIETTRFLHRFAPLLLEARAQRGKEVRTRIKERLGDPSQDRPNGSLVWLNAASVGEINAALPLVNKLNEIRPDLFFLITTSTVTSANILEKRLPSKACHQFVPLDTPQATERFLNYWRPDLVIFTESEIWPNLILKISKSGIPLALINARMSSRSQKRWIRRKHFARKLFSQFEVVLAQNELLARRFSFLGAHRVEIAGNLKIDAPPLPIDQSTRDTLEQSLHGRKVIIAASTHLGEEHVIAEAHSQLKQKFPEICTVIAPRHPERGNIIYSELTKKGLIVAQRSKKELPDSRTDIYLADTIGELGAFFSIAEIVFIGGTLVPHGGQNPIEAIRHNAVVISGPSKQNFADIFNALRNSDALLEVQNIDELIIALDTLLSDQVKYQKMLVNSQRVLADLQGALAKTIEILLPLLPPLPQRDLETPEIFSQPEMKLRSRRVVS